MKTSLTQVFCLPCVDNIFLMDQWHPLSVVYIVSSDVARDHQTLTDVSSLVHSVHATQTSADNTLRDNITLELLSRGPPPARMGRVDHHATYTDASLRRLALRHLTTIHADDFDAWCLGDEAFDGRYHHSFAMPLTHPPTPQYATTACAPERQ